MSEIMLSPTLWRSCRVLANERRLRLLKSVLEMGPLSVSEAAAKNALPLSITSAYLRQLNARGFLRVSRQGSQVFYRVGSDPLVQHAELLLACVCDAIRACSTVRDFHRVMYSLTTCTCPRRIKLVRSIARMPALGYDALRRETGLSKTALSRQLEKLLHRRVVIERDERYYLAASRDPLIAQLVQLCL